jgi:Cu/Ag efflux protein CusF
MEYYQGFAYVVEPATSAVRQRIDTAGVARADLGEKPGASITDTVDVIAQVEAIDPESRMVTLKGAQRTVTLKAADDVDLSTVKVGDEVHANYTQSFAVSVLPSPEVSGTVEIESKAVAVGIGFQWGGGTLTMYDGSTHKFKLKGLSVLDVGVSSNTASGEVFKLTDPQDFVGTYLAGQAGGALGGGGASIVMKNKKGVVMRLESKQKGVRLTLAPEGISIESVE